jgi:hypothetical protein
VPKIKIVPVLGLRIEKNPKRNGSLPYCVSAILKMDEATLKI